MASSAMCLCHECIVSYFGQYDVRGFVGEWCISWGFAVIGRACGEKLHGSDGNSICMYGCSIC